MCRIAMKDTWPLQPLPSIPKHLNACLSLNEHPEELLASTMKTLKLPPWTFKHAHPTL